MSNLENRLRQLRPLGGMYPVDIVFVVDATESMGPCLETVKFNVLRLGDDLRDRMIKDGKNLDSLRVRLIVFRDLYDQAESAFEVTPFYELPLQRQEFEKVVSKIEAFGGADPSESGLEALFLAIRSSWRNEPRNLKRRHVIALFTDQDAHEIGAEIPITYAQQPHPKTFTDLKALWEGGDKRGSMNANGKRLILFAPDKVLEDSSKLVGDEGDLMRNTWWSKIFEEWSNCWIIPDTSVGLKETDWDEVLSKLNSTL